MQERDIFIEAVQQPDPAQRVALLDSACGQDIDLRGRVERLLAEHERSESFFLDGHPPEVAGTISPLLAEVPGTQIGPYKLLQQIGEGGFGVVFMAEQMHPVQRKVALKIIKPGMDTRQVIARFEAERQALALMDHPNIAKVFDAGCVGVHDSACETPDSTGPDTLKRELQPDTLKRELQLGRPYFVMELVKGVPITVYCDEKHLSLKERLELFIPVCQAVQHAHQKGIIHRDLKPTNVLVAEYDNEAVPKVIDFGVAKATAQKLTERTMFTQFGQVIGTIEYMSPEQAKLNQLDIDTRSDIYSLGVLLYELLTGETPFDRTRLHSAAFDEMLRIIREEEPPKPSTRLSATKDLPSIAGNRGSEPKRLSSLVRGELDWIVMKALDKDRNRRYETANGMARDIEHYLHDQPVQACPPSASYRFRKFARRNKRSMLAAALVLLALVGGMVATTWQAIRATQAESRAIAEGDAKEQARQEAVANANKAIASAAKEREAKSLAERRLAQVEKSNEILGSIFLDLDPREAEQGKPLRALLAERLDQAAAQLDSEAVGDPLAVARLQNTLGSSQLYLGHAGTAIALLEKSHKTRKALLGPDHVDTLKSMHNMAWALHLGGQPEKALSTLEQVWAKQKEKLGPDHLDTLYSAHLLARGYHDAGRRDEALSLMEEIRVRARDKLGPNHRLTLRNAQFLALLYSTAGRFDEALTLHEETLARQKATLGADHVGTLYTLNGVASTYLTAGQLNKALPLLEETLTRSKQALGPDNPTTLLTMRNLAIAYRAGGQFAKAVALLEEAMIRQTATLGPDHPTTLGTVDWLALAYRHSGDYARAEATFLEALARKRQTLAADDPSIMHTMASLGWNYVRQKRYTEAESLFRECLAIRAKKESNKWQYFETQRGLGASLLAQKKYAEAETHLVQGYQGLKLREATIPPMDRNCLTEGLEQIVELYDAWGKHDEAAKWRKELSERNSTPTALEDSGANSAKRPNAEP